MPNKTTKPYERVLVAIADIAPDSPDMPWVATPQPSRPRTPMFAAVSAFAGVLLIIGIGTVVLTRGDSATNLINAQAPGVSSQAEPPVTSGPSGDVYDSEVAMIWRDGVDRALIQAGWSNSVTLFYSSITPLADGGSVTATVRTDAGELLLVVGFRGFRPGEYSTDPSWQQELTATSEPGEVTDDGTFFVPESSEFPWVMVVTEKGALTIKVEGAALAYEPTDRELMRAMAASLIPTIVDITTMTDGVQANVSTTTVVGRVNVSTTTVVFESDAGLSTTTIVYDPNAGLAPLSALPVLGIDLPGWSLIEATESDTSEDGGARFSLYGLVDESSGYTVMVATLQVRGFQAGSIYETEASQRWPNRTDYESVTIRGYEARMLITDGNYDYFVWRESDDALVTLSTSAAASYINPADQALAVAAAIIDLTQDQWNDMLNLERKTVSTAPPTTIANN